MSKIKIMADSACDIPEELERELDIKILSFSVAVGDDSYLERVDFTNQEFYDILASAPKLPSTAQITSMQFYEEFKAVQAEGYPEMIYISINGTGSSTLNNARMAREKLYEKHPEYRESFKIHLVDSKAYTIAYGYPVIEAAKKARRGASSAEILGYLEDWFDSVEIYFAPFTLEFVKKSGRVSCAAAFVGELIGLRPIISIIDGKTEIVEKVRGDKAIVPALMKHAQNRAIPQTPVMMVQAKEQPEADLLEEKIRKGFAGEFIGRFPVGAAIAVNTGPKVLGVIIKGKNRRTN